MYCIKLTQLVFIIGNIKKFHDNSCCVQLAGTFHYVHENGKKIVEQTPFLLHLFITMSGGIQPHTIKHFIPSKFDTEN